MLIFVLALLTFAEPQNAPVPPDARATIAAANADWIPAMKKGDAAAVAAPYADDGVFVTATGFVARGRDQVAQLMRSRFTQMGTMVSGSLVQDGMLVQGSLIYEWGHADVTASREGAAPQHTRGRYLTVWQNNGGKWQIIRNLSLPE